VNAGDRVPLGELDLAEIGRALVMIAVTSRQMGHTTLASTARDYLQPSRDRNAEMRFVIDVLSQPVADVVSEEDLIAIVRARPRWEP
jgi:hypothetical protein